MIDIETVKKLNAERTQGNWEVESYDGSYGEHRCRLYAIVNKKYPGKRTDIISKEKAVGKVPDAIYNTEFIAAAPDIANKCIALDAINKELIAALQKAREGLWMNLLRLKGELNLMPIEYQPQAMVNISISMTEEFIKIADESLTKAGEL